MIVYAVSLVVGYTLAVVHGLAFIFQLIKRFLRDPSDSFWTVRTREFPPQCLSDPRFGHHGYVHIKNVKLHYVEAGDRSQPLMLFLHGFPEFWYSWRHQLTVFSSDYWVVAVDMRGYGDSAKPIGKENYKMNLLVSDIKDLIVAFGKTRCTLVAHDWGGCVAWFLLLTEPQMFHSYVIMNSIHPEAYHLHIMKHYSQLKKSWYRFFFQLPWLPELWARMDDLETITTMLRSDSVKSPSPITEDDIEAYKFYFGKPGAFTAPINYYRANFLSTSTARFHGLGKSPDFPPGLIIFGERDSYIDKEIQEDTTRLVANCTLVYIKDANHFVQQDDPVTVNNEMKYFLNNLSSREKS